MRDFFSKALLYCAVILAAFGIDCVFHTNRLAETMILFMVCVTEASSVFEKSSCLGFRWPVRLREQVRELEQSLSKEKEDDE